MLYRVRQFIWAALAKLTDEDLEFINCYLSKYEMKIFSLLPVFIQVHSIKVAKGVLDECQKRDIYDVELIKAALLHDIGQANMGLNPFTKSIMVIADKLFPRAIRRCNKIGFVKAYYEHGEMALDILEGEGEYTKFLIRNHHNYSLQNDEKLKILQEVDSRN